MLLIPLLAGVLRQASGLVTLNPSVVVASAVLLAGLDFIGFIAAIKIFGMGKILSRI